MRTHRPEHLRQFDYVGLHRYFLTFCTNERRRAFVSADRVDVVRRQILRAATDERMAMITYCFMPDHAHLLVEGRAESSNGLSFIARAKQLSGYYYKREFAAKLWQRYGYERVLRENEPTLGVARYILENPVRAGLVTRAGDYPFLGSTEYSIAQILEAIQIEPWK